MPANLLSLMSFVLISTFTPGPSNLSSASFAILYGYLRTVKYQLDLSVGEFVVMIFSRMISASLLRLLPALEPALH